MINTTTSKIHWNYFIALEEDLENVSRYVEFCEQNFYVYSIELAHLLFASASEVDVVAKLLCKRFRPKARCQNINDYRRVLLVELPDLPKIEIFIDRYGLSFKPWGNWLKSTNGNPLWWGDYNDVKHERDACFDKATLKNAINAMGALLILIYYYYSYELTPSGTKNLHPKDATRELNPESKLLTLPKEYYHSHLIV